MRYLPFSKWFLLPLLLFVLTGSCFAENIFGNGDLEDADISAFCATMPENAECSRMEYADGEYGLKFTITSYKGSEVSCSLVIGATGKEEQKPSGHLLVKPNTTYEFSFEISGTIPFTWTRCYQWPEEGENDYVGRVQLDHTTNGPFLNDPEPVPGKPNWTRYTGYLITTDDAYYLGFRFYVWGRASDYTPGPDCYILLDNFFITEQKEMPQTPTGLVAVRNNGTSAVTLS